MPTILRSQNLILPELSYKVVGALFEVFDELVLELKIGARFRKADFEQVKGYLKATSCPLGILARIDHAGVTFHRVLRPFADKH